jgi:phosphoglycerate kinase
MEFRKLEKAKIDGKTVLLRLDYNVPIKKGKITDDFKIRESLKTIKYLQKKKCKIAIISHLGKPKGVEERFRMRSVAEKLSKILGKKVLYAKEYIGPLVKAKIHRMKSGEIILLENLRFNLSEEINDKIFSKKLADLCDIYVNDAFAVSHREHASVVGVTKYLPAFAGFLMEKEIKELSSLLNPKKPFYALLGGAKLSTKLKLIKGLIQTADKVLIGGAIAFTFLKAEGKETGKNPVEDEFLRDAKKILESGKIILPIDFLIAFDKNSKNAEITEKIPENKFCFDIGPKSSEIFLKELEKAKTIFWNGTLGYAENKTFAKSTIKIAKEMSKMKKKTIIAGGGDTAKIIHELDLEKKFTYVSTGGGASLQFLTEKLPGIKALEENKKKFN